MILPPGRGRGVVPLRSAATELGHPEGGCLRYPPVGVGSHPSVLLGVLTPHIIKFRVSFPADKEVSVRGSIPPRNELSTDNPDTLRDGNFVCMYLYLWPLWKNARP